MIGSIGSLRGDDNNNDKSNISSFLAFCCITTVHSHPPFFCLCLLVLLFKLVDRGLRVKRVTVSQPVAE